MVLQLPITTPMMASRMKKRIRAWSVLKTCQVFHQTLCFGAGGNALVGESDILRSWIDSENGGRSRSGMGRLPTTIWISILLWCLSAVNYIGAAQADKGRTEMEKEWGAKR